MLVTETEKLKTIQNKIIILGESVLILNQLILTALENCDTCELGEIVKISKRSRYKQIDDIDNMIVSLIARFTPEARDLREMVAFLKITNEFDRIANSCHSFIRDFPKALTEEVDKDYILEFAVPLQKSSVSTLVNVIEIIKTEDKEKVRKFYKTAVIEEAKNDELYKIIERSLLNKTNENIHLSKDYQNIMAALRRLEKIADRALCAASLMHFAKLGGEISRA